MIKDNSKYTIYILQLEQGKYYVGRTKHKEIRLKDHFSGRGCIFTRKYKPEKVLQTFYNCDEYDEDKYLFKVMDLYGIDNTRGGCFSSLSLSVNDRSYIEKRILGASDRCYHCKSPSHFMRECPERTYKQSQLALTAESSSTVSSLSDDNDTYSYSTADTTTTTTTQSKEEYNFGFVDWVTKKILTIKYFMYKSR